MPDGGPSRVGQLVEDRYPQSSYVGAVRENERSFLSRPPDNAFASITLRSLRCSDLLTDEERVFSVLDKFTYGIKLRDNDAEYWRLTVNHNVITI